MFKVEISGFTTLVQASEFCSWYSNQGEQDASVWFGDRMEEGVIDTDFIPSKGCHIIRDTVFMQVEPVIEEEDS